MRTDFAVTGIMIAEQLHTRLLENLSTAVLMLDEHLHLTHMNASAEVLLGLSGRRHINERIDTLLIDAEEMMQILQETLIKTQAHTQREAVLKSLKSGEVVNTTVDYTVTPIEDIPGNALIIEIQPIDRLLKINREATLFSAQESNEALLKGLAHEIKNPLGGLRGAAQLLAQDLEEPELKEYTKIIIDEADRLRNLVDRLLGPNKVDSPKSINIHEVLERVCSLFKAEVGEQIDLLRDYDPSIPDLIADDHRLIQAVLNIVNNAKQALLQKGNEDLYSENGREIKISSRILRHFTIGRMYHKLVCRIDITDNGPGIDESIIDKIFVPMVSGYANNSGLGLAISQSILNQHNGLIACKSKRGETIFSLFLPLDFNQA